MTDITRQFHQACSALPDGHLVKRPELQLLNAINAIEMMDARLDTGMILCQPSSSTQVFDPASIISARDCCWIMDELLSLEIAFYRGAPLCTTVYTSLYYHNPDSMLPLPSNGPQSELVSVVLRSYILAYAKTIDVAFTEMAKGHVFDGEDVWLDDCGLPVQLTDPVGDLLGDLDYALDWLDRHEVVSADQLAMRLQLRAALLRGVCVSSDVSFWDMIDACRNLQHIDDPSRIARASFDPAVMSHLRQGAPPPPFSKRNHRQTFSDLSDILYQLQDLRNVSPDSWESFLKGRDERMSGLVRSLYKSTLDPPRGSGIACVSSEELVTRWLRYHSPSLPPDVLPRLNQEVQNPADRRAFAIWRDLLGGFYLSTLFTPLKNPARRHRAYTSLSFSWHERAALAQRFDSALFHEVATILLATSLDCLLEAALLTLTLDLISPAEQREAWWWIACVGEARQHLGWPTWQQRWAGLWVHIGHAMQALLTAWPPAGPKPSRTRFDLRHKWARKMPTLPNGQKLGSRLRPRFEDWRNAARILDAGGDLRAEGVGHIETALIALKHVLPSDPFPRGLQTNLEALGNDLTSLLEVVAIADSVEWTFGDRWIPRAK